MTDYLRGLLEGVGISIRGISQNFRSLDEVMDDLVGKWGKIPTHAREEIAKEMLS